MNKAGSFTFDHVSQSIACFGRYENPELLAIEPLLSKIGEGSCALDIGANIGNHTVFFSAFFDQVFSFEPNPVAFELLELNVADYKNVRPYRLGASSSEGELEFAVNQSNFGSSRIVDTAGGKKDYDFRVEVKALDLLAEIRSETISFVKLDVEGHELQALQGMRNILMEQRPVISVEQRIVEIKDGTSPVIEFLKSLGYANFYSIERRSSTMFTWLPPAIRHPILLFTILFSGDITSQTSLKRVVALEPKFYPMLLVSAEPLS